MIKLRIDEHQIEVGEGATILQAANRAGIAIPTLCHCAELPHQAGCMVCLVRLSGQDRLVPACTWPALPEMEVDSCSQVVVKARRAALELLLSDHLGDCIGPCQAACPASISAPLMLSQIAAGQFKAALATIKQKLTLPASLGRICPAFCEKACRRGQIDNPLPVRLSHRLIAELDLDSPRPWQPEYRKLNGLRVAVVGAGPTGLAATFQLRQRGYSCHLIDDHENAGGMLRYGLDRKQLPRRLLEAEIATLFRPSGVEFRGGQRIDLDRSLSHLQKKYDAVLLATGQASCNPGESSGLPLSRYGLTITGKNFQTSLPGVFTSHDKVHAQLAAAVRAVNHGRNAAIAIDQYLQGRRVIGQLRKFNNKMGALKCGEQDPRLFNASSEPGNQADGETGLSAAAAQTEARRCLHCECRKAEKCKLRELANLYQVRSGRYRDPGRKLFHRNHQHQTVVYEPGKCILCGRCLILARAAGEETGLSLVNRGFHTQIGPSLNHPLSLALQLSGPQCAEQCPTGALALAEKKQ